MCCALKCIVLCVLLIAVAIIAAIVAIFVARNADGCQLWKKNCCDVCIKPDFSDLFGFDNSFGITQCALHEAGKRSSEFSTLCVPNLGKELKQPLCSVRCQGKEEYLL
jgi:hypothetical protein